MFLFCLLNCINSAFWTRKKIPRDHLGLPYLPDCKILYYENFSDPNVLDYWIPTMHFRYRGKWKAEQLFALQSRRGERGIVAKDKEVSHAISHKFRHPISAPNQTLLIQFEARAQFLFLCTSGFMKLFTDPDFDPAEFSNSTAHILEFGPERCDKFNQTRLSFFTTETDGEKTIQVEHKLKNTFWIPVDEITHLYTLIIRPDNTFEYLIDNRSMRNGTFIDDFDTPVIETPYIDDPNDKKPSDWDDRVLIRDPNEKKPDDWDDDAPPTIPDPKKVRPPPGWLIHEERFIPDPKSVKPLNWDESKLGEWEPEQIPNPKCIGVPGCGRYVPPKIRNPKARGKWRAKYVPNPNYKGIWRPRKIKNPKYTGDLQNKTFVLPPITGIGFDVWCSQRDFAFTNLLISTNETAVKKWNDEDFRVRQRRQIRAMKISYDWVFTDEPPDRPGPGVVGILSYLVRCLKRAWNRIPNKPIVIAISLSVILITIPLVLICCDICYDDPFGEFSSKKVD